jgi:hypothetical protein
MWVVVLSTALFLLLSSVSAQAQENRRRLDFSQTEGAGVRGEVRNPQVEYIITRKTVDDDESLRLRESFIPRILRSVEKKPF